MILQLTDRSPEPLHGQISRQVRAHVLSGELADGEALPSIRALARQEKVSVITVKRAYEDLEREGLIHARRGKGFFVSQISERGKSEMATDRLRDAMREVVQEARAEGLAAEEIRSVFRELLDETVGAPDE